jgi:alginate O-acetyltransferase complex protein AlgI
MVFSSILFLLYFLPAFLICYYAAPKKFRNPVILVFSIFFYSWGAPQFIGVILSCTFLDFFLVRWMNQNEKPFHRKLLLALSVSVNLGLLIYFKYANFFIDTVNEILLPLGIHAIQWTKLILPIGISFYTFETITYVVDVYRRQHKPLSNFWDYQLYIILFPKLIAGPIVRYHDLADQITNRSENETTENRLTGFYRFVIGLSKKVLIANQMGLQADLIFSMDYPTLGGATAWIGILAYTFQIYFDFSGYSDMALGLGKMIGFKFPENFNNPYTAASITDFWKRWHITLGNWMRNYLYIPLGGNRVNTKSRLYFNLWFVFLVSGLWHGASWSFVIWGGYHGLFLVLERSFLLNIYAKIGKLPATLITFMVVVIGWVFFRVEKLDEAFTFLNRLVSLEFKHSISIDFEFWFYFLLAAFFSFFSFSKFGKNIQNNFYSNNYSLIQHAGVSMLSILLLMLCISSITAFGFNPFIYFRF